MNLFIKRVLAFLKQSLFPDKCLVCRREGSLGCDLHPLPEKSDFIHLKPDTHFLVWAATQYHLEMNQALVKALKFKRQKSALAPMVNLMYKTLDWDAYNQYTLVPIPLHWSRRWWRGFNQTELMVNALSKKTGLKTSTTLQRIKRTQPQSQLDKLGRDLNLNNAFKCNSSKALPLKIILVDDVCTTGNTLKAAAQVLSRAGVEDIVALVFAYQAKK